MAARILVAPGGQSLEHGGVKLPIFAWGGGAEEQGSKGRRRLLPKRSRQVQAVGAAMLEQSGFDFPKTS